FALTMACGQKVQYGSLEPLGSFPAHLEEVSGIAQAAGGNFWVIQDSGNKNEIHLVDAKAQLIKSLKIDNAKNRDWEELALDSVGNLYIGDFGNNDNERRDLTIYKLTPQELEKQEPMAEKLEFNYPEQKAFPPQKSARYYDAEGFFHYGDQF